MTTLGVGGGTYGGTTRGHNSPQAATCSTGEDRNAHNPSARKGRSLFRGVAFSAPQLARPPAIYVEEGQRSERSITLVQLMPRSASRSASRPQKSSSRY